MTGPVPIVLALALAACAVGSSPAGEGSRVARIDVVPGPTYRVAVLVRADGEASGTYSLRMVRTGSSGTSRTHQSGSFELSSGETDTLSVSRVNAVSGDVLRAELNVEWADGATAHDTYEGRVD